MNADDVAEFEGSPYAKDAVALRRWDEAAKDPDLQVPGFDHFRALLESLISD